MPIRNTTLTNEEIDPLFKNAEKIFFIGIGGISMSALAKFCGILGKEVYGYDRERSTETEALEKIGKIKYCSTPDNIKGMDLVIYTNAIDEKNYEYRQARKLHIPLISRANFLGYIASLHKRSFGACGMHGKSTVTALLAHIFYSANENPSVFCGAEMNNFMSNCHFGGRECCIFEACEYQNSFLSMPTTDAIVLNIDFDHPDFFESLDQIKSSFQAYINGAKRVFLNCDDKNVRELCHKNIITFGFDNCAMYRGEICDSEHFNVYRLGKFLCACHLPLCGKHMAYNCLCAIAVSHTYGIQIDKIIRSISTFTGVKRRMEFIGKTDTGASIFEDYGHHPTEIKASLSSLSETGYKRILCIFQAHTFSRTHFLYKDFTSAFFCAKELIICPTFSAREENVFELSEEAFAHDCGGTFISEFSEIRKKIDKTECDCVVLMGAGDLRKRLKL